MGAAANHEEESSPLLPAASAAAGQKLPRDPAPSPAPVAVKCCANGVPVVMGEPVAAHAVGGVPRESWDSGILSCLGRNDEFCSSDLEVCLLGSIAPCVLYGSNVERLAAGQGTFANSCLPYTGLYMLGYSLFGWNCLAPWFSHPTRTAIRRSFNLEGSFEAFTRQCGCFRGLLEDEERREHLEVACDLATHYLCHPCALCQEGRELRRRVPHPGFNNGRSVFVMMPPMEQTMGRGM
ncbi:cell number regulator 8-like [Phragmites australis]|uniref:cell number regulator 8-like n=1 Tax=Phragmites australis TaxID=29695 RepID=UPI002D772E2A|nr:cell number regulator 8-like [Phragmites australis]